MLVRRLDCGGCWEGPVKSDIYGTWSGCGSWPPRDRTLHSAAYRSLVDRCGGVSVRPSSRASPAPTVVRPTRVERTASGMSVQ